MYPILSSKCLVLLIMEVGAWRDVKVVWVGDKVRWLFAKTLVWGDVDPQGGGLGAREAVGGAIIIEVRASALFECLWGWIDDAHACEVVRCLTMRQCLKQMEKVSAILPEVVMTARRKRKMR